MTSSLEQHRYNISRGPYFEGRDALPAAPPKQFPVRYIAYYLPQFHAIPENDAWWGRGFTEWTNVTKAMPRFVGHYQPRLPADLGFYDLSDPRNLRRQAELASLGGIYGFCIHTYWFSGRRVLETPLNLLLQHRDIDLRFCVNWANENWSRRWDGSEQDILLEQRHDPDDELRFAEALLPVFDDERYIRVEGRPLLMVYRPAIIPGMREKVERWREFFAQRGYVDPYIIMAQTYDDRDPRQYGMDGAAGFPPHNGCIRDNGRHAYRYLDPQYRGGVFRYEGMRDAMLRSFTTDFTSFPAVSPDWDNEARKPARGVTFVGSTPAKYGEWLRAASAQALQNRAPDERIVFINAWNEWAEGAYLEPDRHHGFAYLAETARAMRDVQTGHPSMDISAMQSASHPLGPRTAINKAREFPERLHGYLRRRWGRRS